ncbi:hypothetical protein IPM19_04405 [bacterium]|nr:MAG: hypothetical protein IPM19_04405 [bacterium]
MPNKRLMAVVVVGFLIIAGLVYFIKDKRSSDTEQFYNDQVPSVQKTNVDFAKLPDKFPEDIPLETDAKITQNYNSTTPEGHFQATRTFETQLTLAENYGIYEKFLKDNGWTIIATTNDPGYKMIAGSKDKQNIQVTIDENKGSSKTKTVSISYSELKK